MVRWVNSAMSFVVSLWVFVFFVFQKMVRVRPFDRSAEGPIRLPERGRVAIVSRQTGVEEWWLTERL